MPAAHFVRIFFTQKTSYSPACTRPRFSRAPPLPRYDLCRPSVPIYATPLPPPSLSVSSWRIDHLSWRRELRRCELLLPPQLLYLPWLREAVGRAGGGGGRDEAGDVEGDGEQRGGGGGERGVRQARPDSVVGMEHQRRPLHRRRHGGTIIDDNPSFNPATKCDCSTSVQNTTVCHVTKLKIYALNVVGTIPQELQNLTPLT